MLFLDRHPAYRLIVYALMVTLSAPSVVAQSSSALSAGRGPQGSVHASEEPTTGIETSSDDLTRIRRRMADPRVVSLASATQRRAEVSLVSGQNATNGAAGLPGSAVAALTVGFILIGAGAGVGLYGVSDKCHLNNPRTTRCDDYVDEGKGLLIGSLVSIVIGIVLAARASRQQSTAVQPGTPVSESTPPIDRFPPGRQSASDDSGNQAEADRARQAIEEINRGAHETVPAPQVTGRCSGNTATLRVQNQTPAALSLYLSGPTSQAVVVDAGGVGTLKIAAGHYDVGARVATPNVRPFSSTWDLLGCPYNSLFFLGSPR